LLGGLVNGHLFVFPFLYRLANISFVKNIPIKAYKHLSAKSTS